VGVNTIQELINLKLYEHTTNYNIHFMRSDWLHYDKIYLQKLFQTFEIDKKEKNIRSKGKQRNHPNRLLHKKI
jgi:hypothetical protein